MKNFGDKSISKSSPAGVKGGSGKMMKEQHTGPQAPGVTAVTKGSSGGFGAKGGSGKMFGKQTVKAATPA